MKRPDLNGDGKRPIYPKMKIRRTVEMDDLAEIIARRSTFSSGEVKGLISLLSDTMAECMAKGESVRVAGVGLFTASLGLLGGVERAEEGGPQHNARNICVRSVNYRPDRALVENTNSRCELKRGHMPVRALLIEKREDRLAAAVSHIAEKGFLRVIDYVENDRARAYSGGRRAARVCQRGAHWSDGAEVAHALCEGVGVAPFQWLIVND